MVPLISFAAAGLLSFLLIRVYRAQRVALKIFFWPGLILKVISGISLGLIYTYYYPIGDTFGFFNDAQKVSRLIYTDVFGYFDFLLFGDSTDPIAQGLINIQVRSLFFVKILSAITLLSFNSYWVASIYFSSFSFLGSWYLVFRINLFYKKALIASAIAFLALPSFLLWSSGIIKESLAVAALMFMAGVFILLYKKQRLIWWEWLICLLAILTLWNLKYYWAALFVPSMLTSLIVILAVKPSISKAPRFVEFLIWVAIFALLVLLASSIHPNFYLSRLLSVIVENHDAYEMLSGDRPFLNFYELDPTWISVFTNSPWALFSCLYRPFLFEASTAFQFVVGIENLVLLLLTIYNLRYVAQFWKSPERLLIFGMLVYIVLLAIFLALSTPNFGTLSRYRVGLLPFLFFLLLYMPANKFPYINKLIYP